MVITLATQGHFYFLLSFAVLNFPFLSPRTLRSYRGEAVRASGVPVAFLRRRDLALQLPTARRNLHKLIISNIQLLAGISAHHPDLKCTNKISEGWWGGLDVPLFWGMQRTGLLEDAFDQMMSKALKEARNLHQLLLWDWWILPKRSQG